MKVGATMLLISCITTVLLGEELLSKVFTK
uniref:Uncharacterized protein n=1 Tax=Rhizophora mucronata TaxID=61149 RepID=A0A2P2QUM1_RHIMU